LSGFPREGGPGESKNGADKKVICSTMFKKGGSGYASGGKGTEKGLSPGVTFWAERERVIFQLQSRQKEE